VGPELLQMGVGQCFGESISHIIVGRAVEDFEHAILDMGLYEMVM
jgi:hypothetical protein